MSKKTLSCNASSAVIRIAGIVNARRDVYIVTQEFSLWFFPQKNKKQHFSLARTVRIETLCFYTLRVCDVLSETGITVQIQTQNTGRMRTRWWNLVYNLQCFSKFFCMLWKDEWVKNRSGTNGVPFFLCACLWFGFFFLLCFVFLKLQSLLQAWSPFQQPVWLEHKLSKREPTPIQPVVDKGLSQWRCQLLEMLSIQVEWLWYVFNFPIIFLKVEV